MALKFDTLATNSVSANFNEVNTLYGGATSLATGTGNDVLIGWNLADSLFGLDGDDTLWGGEADDVAFGGEGNDYLVAFDGIDLMYGDAGIDTLFGQNGTDTAWGGDGNDSLFGGFGDDLTYGGDGNDLINDFDGGNDVLSGDAGNDQIFGNTDSNVLYGGAGNDSLLGFDGNDRLFGGDGNDSASGGNGSDTLQGGAGADILDGGPGDDTVVYVGSTVGTVGQGSLLTVLGTNGDIDILANVEHIVGLDSTTDFYPYFVDALRNEVGSQFFRSWWNVVDGQPITLTYSFMSAVPTAENPTTIYGNPAASFLPFTELQREYARQALAAWSAVSGLNFVEISSSAETAGTHGTLEFGRHQITGAAGYASYPFVSAGTGAPIGGSEGNIWIDSDFYSAPGESLHILLHEIGHALGLQHPHDNVNRLPSSEDSWLTTALSYTWDGGTGNDLGIYDIIAIQSAYGPDAGVRAGNNAYTFGSDSLIWDGGGTDTITAANAGQAVHIDLDDGSWNWQGAQASLFLSTGQVFLGYYSFIESLIGSTAGDWLSGNELGNGIFGGNGSDTIGGDAGNDALYGGAAEDSLAGNAGADALDGGAGNDTLDGGADGDGLTGGDGNDRIYGGAAAGSGDDWLVGGDGQDSGWGGDGNDVLLGDQAGAGTVGARDGLYGGDGSDYGHGGPGDDTIEGGAGVDWLEGSSGNDLMRGGPSGDYIDGQDGNDLLYGEDGDAIFGLAGNDVIYGGDTPGVADDWIWGDDFAGTAYGGADTIFGGSGIDVLFAGAGNDRVEGGADDDYAEGQDGSDTLEGDVGNDFLIGGNGNDTVYGDVGLDVVGAADGNDLVYGGGEADLLFGGTGNDVLYGGGDDGDLMYGDAGADTFVLTPGEGWDIVADWDPGDVIDVTAFAIAGGGFAALGFTDLGGGVVWVHEAGGLNVNVALGAGEALVAGDFSFT